MDGWINERINECLGIDRLYCVSPYLMHHVVSCHHIPVVYVVVDIIKHFYHCLDTSV